MSREEQLFGLIGSSKFEKASLFLQANSMLDINALNKSGCSFIIMAIRMSNKTQACYAFIEALLTHPQFVHHNTISDTDNTPFGEAICNDDATLAKILLKYQTSKSLDVIYDDGELLFKTVTNTIHQIEKKIKGLSERNEILEIILENQKDILNLLRTPTIRHAIAHDDLSMLQKLADLGANLHKPLADGVECINLITPKTNPKSNDWLIKHVKEKNESCPEYRINKIRERNEALEKERAQKEQEIINVHIQKRNERIGLLFGLKAPEQKNESSLPNKNEPTKTTTINNSLFKTQEMEKEMQRVSEEHYKKRLELTLKSLDQTEDLIRNTMNILNKK